MQLHHKNEFPKSNFFKPRYCFDRDFKAVSERIVKILFSGKILSVNVNKIFIELKFLGQDR